MDKKPKIKISEDAFTILKKMLEDTKEYTTVRFSYSRSCCRPKVEIFLDILQNDMISDSIENLPIQYDLDFAEKIKSVTLIYSKSSFMVKPELYEEPKKNCESCCKDKDSSCNICSKGAGK